MKVTLSFNAKMDLANFECSLKTRTPRNGPVKVTCHLWEHRRSGPETELIKAHPILTCRQELGV